MGIMCRKWILIVPFILSSAAFSLEESEGILPKNVHTFRTEEEALAVSRVIEFVRDEDKELVKKQIERFLPSYPESEFRESFLAILGDIYWEEGRYESALGAYNKITKSKLKTQVFNKRLDCLYHLKLWSPLADQLRPYQQNVDEPLLSVLSEQETFYYAEALLRLAREAQDPQDRKQKYSDAKTGYERLAASIYKDNAALGLAEIHHASGEVEEAATIYINLAGAMPEHAEKLLYQAADISQEVLPERSLRLFDKVISFNGQLRQEACFKKLKLMFERHRYKEILEEASLFEERLSKQEACLLNLYLGRSAHHLGEFPRAIKYLQEYLAKSDATDPLVTSHVKTAYLTLIACCYESRDFAGVHAIAKTFTRQFVTDPLLAKVLYADALAYQQEEKYDIAFKGYVDLLENFPNFEKKQQVEFYQALLLYKKENYAGARLSFAAFLEKYPHTDHHASALRLLSFSSIKAAENLQASGDFTDEDRRKLIVDLDLALADSFALDGEIRAQYLIIKGQTLQDLHLFEEAAIPLQEVVTKHVDDKRLFQAYYLLGIGYVKVENKLEEMILCFENALSLKGDMPVANSVRLHLFSAYQKLAIRDPSKEKIYLEKAAHHLYAVATTDRSLIKWDNLLWLGSHYYGRALQSGNDLRLSKLITNESVEQARRAEFVLGCILQDRPDPKEIWYEFSGLRLATVKCWLGKFAEGRDVLALIVSGPQKEAFPYHFRGRSLLLLALLEEGLGHEEKALEHFKTLVTNRLVKDEHAMDVATLHLSRLVHNLGKDLGDKKESVLLSNLKDLQIKKKLLHEPVHLEAGLAYAKIRASMETEERQQEQYLFSLKRAKENFETAEDIWSRQYRLDLAADVEKKMLYDMYMLYYDLEIAKVQAKISRIYGLEKEAAEQELQASRLQEELEHHPLLTEYLVAEIEKGKGNAYYWGGISRTEDHSPEGAADETNL